MARNRVVVKRGALYDLRRMPGVRRDLERRASAAHADTGGDAAGYGVSSSQGEKRPQGRWRVAIFTKNFDAILDNHRNHTLIRCLDRARG